MKRLLLRYLKHPPAMPSIVAFLIPFLVFGAIALLSMPLGTGGFVDEVPNGAGDMVSRHVGYLVAPNWGLASITVLPLLFLYIYRFLLAFPDALNALRDRRMLVDHATGEPVSRERLAGFLSPIAGWMLAMAAFVVLFAVSYSLWDFGQVAGRHLLAGTYDGPTACGIPAAIEERDWSVAAVLPSGSCPQEDGATCIGSKTNFVFDLIVYLLVPGISVGVSFGFCLLALGLQSLFNPARLRRAGILLLPDCASSDKRLGFEVLSELLRCVIAVVVLAIAGVNAMALQNIYLRTCHESFLTFMMKEGMGQGLEGGESILTNLGDILGFVFGQGAHLNNQVFIAVALGFFLGVVVLFMTVQQVQGAIGDARRQLRTLASPDNAERPSWIAERCPENCADRLEAMPLWPVLTPGLQTLGVYVAIGILATLFYRITFLFTGIVVFWLLVRALSPFKAKDG